MIANGKNRRGIASALGISPKTVAAHRENILAKLDLKNTAELVAHALRSGLFSSEK